MADRSLQHQDKYTVVATAGKTELVDRFRDQAGANLWKGKRESEGYTVEILPPFHRPLTADIPHGLTETGRIDTRTKEWQE